MRRRLIPLLAMAFVLVAGARDATALGERTLARKLAVEMRQAAPASGAYVENLTTGERVYQLRAQTARIPASNEKLWTTVAALERFGEDGVLRTTALALRPLSLNGTLQGNLYLRGEGDPTLSTARLEVLAQDLADAGLSRVTGRVIGDESAFDSRRGPVSRGIDSDVGGPLGALILDRGASGAADPAAHAAEVLARQLRDAGVKVSLDTRSQNTPPGALALALARSASIRTLIQAMNVPSDNFLAEMLLKAVGMTEAARATTRRGAAYASRVAEKVYGVAPEVVDGSGLSRRDRASPRDLVSLLGQLVDDDAFFRSLAVMGVSGTLDERLESSPARGRCRGKTGSLRDVSALSGYCETLGGDVLAYSIMMNRTNVFGARAIQDRMASLIVRLE
ncbi:MAG: D-alanyl-D-alanine carboxypeptidase/D-alanyl-D-alanine-endopeptidase [Solirubrobacteraceae bacterium]